MDANNEPVVLPFSAELYSGSVSNIEVTNFILHPDDCVVSIFPIGHITISNISVINNTGTSPALKIENQMPNPLRPATPNTLFLRALCLIGPGSVTLQGEFDLTNPKLTLITIQVAYCEIEEDVKKLRDGLIVGGHVRIKGDVDLFLIIVEPTTPPPVIDFLTPSFSVGLLVAKSFVS